MQPALTALLGEGTELIRDNGPSSYPSIACESDSEQPRSLRQGTRASTAATLHDLRAAFADPGVASVTLTGHITLTDSAGPLTLAGAGRVLSVSAGAACAGATYAAASRALPPGTCVLDALGGSQHFLVLQGASLNISGLALLNGYGLQGGCVLVKASAFEAVGSAFRAFGCFFMDSTSLGDGGALAVVGPATAVVTSSALRAPALRAPPWSCWFCLVGFVGYVGLVDSRPPSGPVRRGGALRRRLLPECLDAARQRGRGGRHLRQYTDSAQQHVRQLLRDDGCGRCSGFL